MCPTQAYKLHQPINNAIYTETITCCLWMRTSLSTQTEYRTSELLVPVIEPTDVIQSRAVHVHLAGRTSNPPPNIHSQACYIIDCLFALDC